MLHHLKEGRCAYAQSATRFDITSSKEPMRTGTDPDELAWRRMDSSECDVAQTQAADEEKCRKRPTDRLGIPGI